MLYSISAWTQHFTQPCCLSVEHIPGSRMAGLGFTYIFHFKEFGNVFPLMNHDFMMFYQQIILSHLILPVWRLEEQHLDVFPFIILFFSFYNCRLSAGEGGDRGWDGWMALPTQSTWGWANSGIWWRIGKPGVLQSMGSQRKSQTWLKHLSMQSHKK